MNHSFDTEIAKEYGVNAAIIYQNIFFWCAKNKANNKNFFDDNYWTYNSVKAWKELFPYLGDGAIRNALKKLEDAGLIASGEYNQNRYDRTKWYAILELSVLTNGVAESNEPIPDNKPDNKPDTSLLEEVVLLWNNFAEVNNKSTVMKLTGKRKEKLTKRIKELKDYRTAFKIAISKASISSFCIEGKWFSFDWLIDNDTNMIKVIEDKYKNSAAEYK